jgi:prolyl 4-hydroxylase
VNRGQSHVLWRGSEVVRLAPDGRPVTFRSDERTSHSTTQKWFSEELNEELNELEMRLETDFGPPPSHLEHWQVVKYEPGGRFGLHADGGAFAAEPAGERVLTFLVYVQSPEAGGETYFPQLNRFVKPATGRMAVWHNLLPDGTVNRRFQHAATPARGGTKTVLTTWSRQHAVRTPA